MLAQQRGYQRLHILRESDFDLTRLDSGSMPSALSQCLFPVHPSRREPSELCVLWMNTF
jgi:hypothetical protein